MQCRNHKTNEPAINRKAPKNNMTFEYISIAILIVFLIYIVGDVTSVWIAGTVQSANSAQQTSSGGVSLSSIASAVIALYALVWQLRLAIQSKQVLVDLELTTQVDEKNVMVSCSLKNIGTKTIYPNQTNLYITEGVVSKNSDLKDEPVEYKFEPITDHVVNRDSGECFDCRLAEHCKSTSPSSENGKVTFPREKYDGFENTLRFGCNFRMLSYKTLEHVMPKEKFTQDIYLEFSRPGVYQALVLYTGRGWDDCICRSTVFVIK